MKTKIFKVTYESKEMYLMATKFSDNTEEEEKIFNKCKIEDDLVLFDFIDQNPYREEDEFMFMTAKEFISNHFETLKPVQDIRLKIGQDNVCIIYTTPADSDTWFNVQPNSVKKVENKKPFTRYVPPFDEKDYESPFLDEADGFLLMREMFD